MRNKILVIGLFLSISFSSYAQIPAGYYDSAAGLNETALKNALHNIINNHTEYSYDDLRDFILENTDEDPNNSNNIILLYSGRSQAKSTFGGNPDDWNREHVWAKSHGDFDTNPPEGTDAHHLRPTDASVNSSRGNLDFDNGGNQHSEATGCYYDSDSWEPRDAVKGDVARMILYMAVRYEGDNGELDLEVVDYVNSSPTGQPLHGKLSTLLMWNNEDTVDAFEANRNEVIYGYQNNRNPFIDHPEYVDMIWDYQATIKDNNYKNEVFSVYPNPTKDFFYISTTKKYNDIIDIEIYNTIGGKALSILNINFNNKMEVDISELKQGVYFVKIIGEQESQLSKIIVK